MRSYKSWKNYPLRQKFVSAISHEKYWHLSFFWVVQRIIVAKKIEEHTFLCYKWLKRIFVVRFFEKILKFFWNFLKFLFKIEEKTRKNWWFCMKTSSYWWKWYILVLNLCFNSWNTTIKKWIFAVKCYLECTLCHISFSIVTAFLELKLLKLVPMG